MSFLASLIKPPASDESSSLPPPPSSSLSSLTITDAPPPRPTFTLPPRPGFAQPLRLPGAGLSQSTSTNTIVKRPPPKTYTFGLLHVEMTGVDDACVEWRKGKTCTDVMRNVDKLRFHETYKVEEGEFNLIPGRLNVHNSTTVLSLCGSRRGVRFTTPEIITISTITALLDPLYHEIDESFKGLSNADKKVKDVTASDREQGNESLNSFASKVTKYLNAYKTIVEIVANKRELLLSKNSDEVFIADDPEAEMKLSSPMPPYLALLITKYNVETNPKKPHATALSDSLVRLSAFFAYCILNLDYVCRCDEIAAFDELISGSSDGSSVSSVSTTARTEAYWRGRVFNFLKGMRELKSIPKKEKDMEERWDWEEGGVKIERRRVKKRVIGSS